jgi:hypothetical protein
VTCIGSEGVGIEAAGPDGRFGRSGDMHPQLKIEDARKIHQEKHVPAILAGKDPNASEDAAVVDDRPKVGDMLKAYCATLKPVARKAAESVLLGPINKKTRERNGGVFGAIRGRARGPARRGRPGAPGRRR